MTVTDIAQLRHHEKSSIQRKLPDGWIMAQLKDGLVLDVQPGFACGLNNREGKGIAHLRPMNVTEDGRIDLADVKYVPESEINREERIIRQGDVLFNNTNSPDLVGKTACYELPDPRAFSNHMTRLRCRSDILDPHYCGMALHQKWREGHFMAVCNNHVSQSSVSRTVLLDTPLLIPPLAEQKRIVAKVEELLTRVNKARERLARVRVIFKRFRQAVLTAACSGRLTADWRGQQSKVQHAKDLLSAILAERHQSQEKAHPKRRNASQSRNEYQKASGIDVSDLEELPDGWVWASGVQLFAWSSGKFLPKKKQESGTYPIYGGNGITGYHNEYLVDHPTLVIGRVGALCGNVYITSGKAWITDNAIYAAHVPKKLNLSYIHMVFIQANLNVNAGGSGQPFVNQTILNEVSVPMPPLAEQHEIVRRAEALFKLADSIEKRVAAATAQTEKLPPSILAKAFRGKLVPTEADLASREGRSYEPASALLARIKAEKEPKEASRTIRRGRKDQKAEKVSLSS